MRLSAPFLRQTSYVLFTILILICFFAIYFFGYVTSNEEDINKRAFRILEKIHENIIEKNETIIKNIEYSTKDLENLAKDEKQDFVKLKALYEQRNHNRELELDTVCEGKTPVESSESVINGNSFERNNYVYYNNCLKLDSNLVIRFKVNFQYLVEPFVRKDFFDEFIVFRNGASVYQTLSSNSYFDSLIKSSVITIQGEDYKAFKYSSNEGKWTLCGLKKLTRYNKEKFLIATSSILVLVFVLIIIGLMFPFLKLALISKNERLKVMDILTAWGSLMLGLSLIFLLFLNGYNSLRMKREVIEINLAKLSSAISFNFLEELKKAFHELEFYEKTVLANSDKKLSSMDNKQQTETNWDKADNYFEPEVKHPYNNFDYIFCIDDKGMQHLNFTRRVAYSPHINLSDREYFKDAVNRKLWKISDSISFAFQSIHSYYDGTDEAVISKPVDKPIFISDEGNDSIPLKVIALSSEFNSVIDPLIPMGYAFAVIDESGKVWFHSNKGKNLQENFITECGDSPLINTVMRSRNSLMTSANYLGRKCQIYITPIKKLPLFLVTIYDNNYDVSVKAEVLVLSFIFILILFGFCCFHILLQQVLRPSNPKLNDPKINFEWIIPIKEKEEAYIYSILFLGLTIILVICFSQILWNNEYPPFFPLLNMFLITFTIVFLVMDNLISSKKSDKFFKSDLKGFNIVTLLMLAILNLPVFKYLNENRSVLIFEILLCILAFGILRTYKRTKPFHFEGKKYVMLFTMVLLLWLSILSIIPTYYFYRLTYNQEISLISKWIQLDFAKSKERSNKAYKEKRAQFRSEYTEASWDPKPMYLHSDTAKCIEQEEYAAPREEYKEYVNFLFLIKPRYDSLSGNSNSMLNLENNNEFYCWYTPLADCSKGPKLSIKYKISSGDKEEFFYHNCPVNYFTAPYVFRTSKDFLFWLITWSIVAGLYGVLNYLIKKIFFLEPFRSIHQLQKSIEITSDPLFLISLDNLRSKKLLEEMLSSASPESGNENKEIVWIDLKEESIKDIENHPPLTNGQLVVVNHFEYDLKNPEVTLGKLAMLEQLLKTAKEGLVVISSLHPRQFLETLDKGKGIEVYKKWVAVFSHFNTALLPLNETKSRQKKNNFEDPDEYDFSSNYFRYQSIWCALTEQEKYVAYDLAEDGLVNLRNTPTIEILLAKGVFVIDRGLKIANRGLRAFILSEENSMEALQIERLAKAKGTRWSLLKTPLMLLVLLIGLFILFTQKETGNRMIALITSLLTSFKLLSDFFTSLTSSKHAQSEE